MISWLLDAKAWATHGDARRRYDDVCLAPRGHTHISAVPLVRETSIVPATSLIVRALQRVLHISGLKRFRSYCLSLSLLD